MQTVNVESNLIAFWEHAAAGILYAVAVFIGERCYSRIANTHPSYRRVRLGGFVALWAILNAASLFCPTYWWLVLLITTIPLMVVMYRELNQFWQIGIVGADREVQSGINYAKSLSMCKNSIRFLGIGASKLTDNRETFRKAIDRCHRTAPVRFLLSQPNHPGLQDFARMAGKGEDSYQRTVTESLRFIASLRNTDKKNIEVRFYRQFPAFRLMFIDDRICLMSYYIMGKGNGSNIPQLQIVKNPGTQDTQALYFGFEEYFEKIWNDSTIWDFQEFL